MTLSWNQWLHGLGAALIGSLGTLVGTGITGYLGDYDITSWDFWEPLVGAVLFNAWTSIQLYIRQFPPPGTLTPQDPPRS